jgi:hypothetical protein
VAADLTPARVTALAAAARAAGATPLPGAFAAGLGSRGIPVASAGLAACQAILATAGSPVREVLV